MDDTQRDALRKRMQEEMQTLDRTVRELEDTTNPVEPDVAIGRLSRLDTMLNQGVTKQSLNQGKLRINKLRQAMIRLEEDPFFGECIECGDPIAPARLLALPETELCINCAE